MDSWSHSNHNTKFILLYINVLKFKYFIESLTKWIQYVLFLKQIFIFLLKNYFQNLVDLYRSYPISKVFFFDLGLDRILVLVINDRNEVWTFRPSQQTNTTKKKNQNYWRGKSLRNIQNQSVNRLYVNLPTNFLSPSIIIDKNSSINLSINQKILIIL